MNLTNFSLQFLGFFVLQRKYQLQLASCVLLLTYTFTTELSTPTLMLREEFGSYMAQTTLEIS